MQATHADRRLSDLHVVQVGHFIVGCRHFIPAILYDNLRRQRASRIGNLLVLHGHGHLAHQVFRILLQDRLGDLAFSGVVALSGQLDRISAGYLKVSVSICYGIIFLFLCRKGLFAPLEHGHFLLLLGSCHYVQIFCRHIAVRNVLRKDLEINRQAIFVVALAFYRDHRLFSRLTVRYIYIIAVGNGIVFLFRQLLRSMVDTDLRLDRTSRVGVSVLKSGEPDPVRNRYFRDILCLDLTECPLGVLQKRVGIAAHPALLIAFSGCKCLDGDCFVLRAFLVQDDRPLVAAALLRRVVSIKGIVDLGVLYVFTLRRIHRQGYLRAVCQLLAVRIVRLRSVQLYAFFPPRCIGDRLCHRCIDVKLLLLQIPAEEPVTILLRLVDLHGIEIIALVDRLRRSLRCSPVGIEGNGHRRYCIVERSDLTVCISAPDGDRPDRGFLPDRNACIDIVFQ